MREVEVIAGEIITARIVTGETRHSRSGGDNSCCYYRMLYVRGKEGLSTELPYAAA